jgi:hypothetical protein
MTREIYLCGGLNWSKEAYVHVLVDGRTSRARQEEPLKKANKLA